MIFNGRVGAKRGGALCAIGLCCRGNFRKGNPSSLSWGARDDMGENRNRTVFNMSVAIPAYGRCEELRELLSSIFEQTVLPAEITICEDMSPERDEIREIAEQWREKFACEGCRINYSDNPRNLGYDGNIRNVIASSTTPWVMLVGNDDLLLSRCVEYVEQYLNQNSDYGMISRTVLRFDTDISKPLGTSSLSAKDCFFQSRNSSPTMIMRCAGFVGGLIVNRDWANSLRTEEYDGTLYYQIYLAAEAYCSAGIGYIGKAIVGGRASNPPLFGSASSEQDVHIPGSYTPKGRAKMWASVLRIAADVGARHGLDLRSAVHKELATRQSFHVFEMMAGGDRQHLRELRHELTLLGLFQHPLPQLFYWLNMLLGRNARGVYALVRKVMQ